MQTRQARASAAIHQNLDEQYELVLQDIEADRYEVALQRLQYIAEADPAYPGITEKLVEVMGVLYATATFTPIPTATTTPSPTPLPPTATLTPTRDLRPIQDLFESAQAAIAAQDWDAAIETIAALRKEDTTYEVTRVDGLLYLALRERGVEKILQKGDLEGGMYDLSRAERFGPLDAHANNARTWARLYVTGLSFWEVHPEQAVYYFAQVASAVPNLRDSSGWTAAERYRQALVQYGEMLARNGDWCNAQVQYETAWSIFADESLWDMIERLRAQCSPPTETLPYPSAMPTLSYTPTELPTAAPPTATPNLPPPPTDTPEPQPPTNTPISPGLPPTATPTPTPEPIIPPTDTQASPPTDTPVPPPTQEPPSPTPQPPPTATEAPPPPTATLEPPTATMPLPTPEPTETVSTR